MTGKDNKEDCALKLIGLVGKPKQWRIEASKVLIKHGNSLKTVKLELAGVIGLCVLILTKLFGLVG